MKFLRKLFSNIGGGKRNYMDRILRQYELMTVKKNQINASKYSLLALIGEKLAV